MMLVSRKSYNTCTKINYDGLKALCIDKGGVG